MNKLFKPNQGRALGQLITRERIRRSGLKAEDLKHDPRLKDIYQLLLSEKKLKPKSAVSRSMIKRLA